MSLICVCPFSFLVGWSFLVITWPSKREIEKGDRAKGSRELLKHSSHILGGLV